MYPKNIVIVYVVSDYLPVDAVEVSIEEYGRAKKPTAVQRRRGFPASLCISQGQEPLPL